MSDTDVVRHAPAELMLPSGEIVPATRESAAAVIVAANDAKRRLTEMIHAAHAWLAEESARQGTKTFHTDYGKLTISGGASVEYDPEVLGEELRRAGCPEERVNAAIRTTVTYKVDLRVLRQLTAANPAYQRAAAAAARTVEKALRVEVKSR
jgi:hypothetical protein